MTWTPEASYLGSTLLDMEKLPDGSFPIRNRADLFAAYEHPDREMARDHIIRRAHALALTSSLPEEWAQEDPVEIQSSAGTSSNATAITFTSSVTPDIGEKIVAEADEAAVCIEIEIDGEDADIEETVEMSSLPTWESELAYENLPTSDGRLLMLGQITERELPLSLMCQFVTADGHDGAEICGKLTSVWRVDRPDLGEGVVAIMGAGEFSDLKMGPEACELVETGVLRHVSVDIAPTLRVLLDAETRQEVSEDDFDFEKYANGGYLLGIGGELMGATLCAFSAFAEATMRIIPNGENSEQHAITASASASLTLIPRTITASAAGIAPIAPPAEWFFTPEVDGKLPLTVMDDGRIMGHLATWDQCHHGFMNECVLAKPSRTNYSFFHVGAIKTEEGELVDVGRIIVGETAQAGHASVEYSGTDATRHYDKTALVGAFVRATDGKYGIWLSGVVRSDCPAERVRDMLANPPSGDWRRENGWLELIAALSVPVPGFPVPRYEYAMTASAESVEVKTLIATGYYEVEPISLSRAEQRKKDILLAKGKALA